MVSKQTRHMGLPLKSMIRYAASIDTERYGFLDRVFTAHGHGALSLFLADGPRGPRPRHCLHTLQKL